jgi:hypothetical protein
MMFLKVDLAEYSSQWQQDPPPTMSFSMAKYYFSVFQTKIRSLVLFEETPQPLDCDSFPKKKYRYLQTHQFKSN